MVRDFSRDIFGISSITHLYPSMFVDFHSRHKMCKAFDHNVQSIGVKTYEGTLPTVFEILSPFKTCEYKIKNNK